ncbi:MAG: sulfotransferase [Gammaproteobacteria bacterium]
MQPAQQDNAALAALKREMDEAADALTAGDLARAATTVKSLLTKAPSEHKVLQLAATIALAQNQPIVAADYYRRALSVCRMPLDAARTLHGLGIALRASGDLASSCEAFKRASQANKGNLLSILEWAKTLNQFAGADPLRSSEMHTEAERILQDARKSFPDDPRPTTELGITLIGDNRQAEAVSLFDEALAKSPKFAPALFNRGVALTMLGRINEAERDFEQTLQLEPSMEVYYTFSNLHKFTEDDPWLERLVQRSKHPLQGDAKADIEFALGKAYEGIKDYEKAFTHLELGNREKRGTIEYNILHDKTRVEQIIALFTKDFFERFCGKTSSDTRPIFILGMPRSGSTLIEQMLASHPEVNAGGELPYMLSIAREIGASWEVRKENFLADDQAMINDLQQGADIYAKHTGELHTEGHRFTDKLPGNFQFIGLIRLMFPNAKIINAHRDPVDTCLSCYKKKLFQTAVPYSFDLAELGNYYNLYQLLMQHWHKVLPDYVLDVEYENLLEDTEQELRRILSFCELEFDPACLEFYKLERTVRTASVLQVRKPIYKDSVKRWKNYEPYLTPLLQVLGDPGKG